MLIGPIFTDIYRGFNLRVNLNLQFLLILRTNYLKGKIKALKTNMQLTKKEKKEIFARYGNDENDTGSIEAQVALITEKISILSKHLKTNKKDFSSQRGLQMLVGQRRRLLKYLMRKDITKYRKLIKDLKLRG